MYDNLANLDDLSRFATLVQLRLYRRIQALLYVVDGKDVAEVAVSLDSDLNGCVCANDICKIYGIQQLDLDGEQLGHLGISTRGCKAG